MYIKLHKSNQSGVSLLEILIAVLVIMTGVFGLTKMQASFMVNAQTSGMRAMVALQAGSLAALMRGNATYWQGGAGAALCTNNTCTFSGASTSIFGTVPALSACQSSVSTTVCTDSQIAALNISTWMTNMNQQVPSYATTIGCSGTPTTCVIQINWYEKAVGINSTTATMAAAAASLQQSYYLYVRP